jgi:dihydroorotate dehydrogenase (fumarate)
MDLSTTYLGLSLKNPLVASAGPLAKKLDTARRLEDTGISAIVMYSLFEEQIVHESRELFYYINRTSNAFAEAQMGYFPDMGDYNTGPEGYLKEVSTLKESLSVPIIGSLNGVSTGGWIDYAQKIEQAGADALELNIYYMPTNFDMSSADLEDAYVQLVQDVRAKVQIPIAVKLSPYFSALPSVAKRLVEAGANGLVLFNRFYQPDFDLEALQVVPNLTLSTSLELRKPLHWIAILYGKIQADFAASSGVHTAEDVLKATMAGANVSMTTSALLKFGADHAAKILQDLRNWMEENEYESITQMHGSMSQKAVENPDVFERANYMKVLNSFDTSADGGGMAGGLTMQSTRFTPSSTDEGFMSV